MQKKSTSKQKNQEKIGPFPLNFGTLFFKFKKCSKIRKAKEMYKKLIGL